jgi:hypothetical protein
MSIRKRLNNILLRKKRKAISGPKTAKKYIETEIDKLPVFNDLTSVDLGHCIRCLEKIPGILDPMEGFTLFLLSMSAPSDNLIVEVGSFLGRSAAYMAMGSLFSGKKNVCAIDMFPMKADWYLGRDGYYHIKGSDYYLEERAFKERETFFYKDNFYDNTLSIFKDIIKKVGLEQYIEPFKGTSSEYTQWQKIPLRMVFIDGDHTYEGVKKDVLALNDMIVENGYLCFHDYSATFPGVMRAVDELVKNSGEYSDIFLVKTLLVARKKNAVAKQSTKIDTPM